MTDNIISFNAAVRACEKSRGRPCSRKGLMEEHCTLTSCFIAEVQQRRREQRSRIDSGEIDLWICDAEEGDDLCVREIEVPHGSPRPACPDCGHPAMERELTTAELTEMQP